MRTKQIKLKVALASVAIGWLCWVSGGIGQAQTGGSALPPDLQEVVRLSQAKMPDDIIRNYITSTGKSYRLSADDIIYLNTQGVSAGVIGALQATAQAQMPAPIPAPEPAATYAPQPAAPTMPPPAMAPPPGAPGAPADYAPGAPPPPEVSYTYFHDQLAPFGTWVSMNGVYYWRPDAAMALNPDWRPYYDMGQWVETENGLYWQSDYTWGDIPFHYGRWTFTPGMGWLWEPDYVWGPAWVFWRHDEVDGCIGWAPLPPGAVFFEGGFRYRGAVVGLDFDFGLGEACFTFVSYDHFHERFVRMRGREWAGHIDHERLHGFYAHSQVRNDFHRDDHGRFVNNGIGRDRVEHLTHVEHSNFQERNPVGDRNRMAGPEAHHAEAEAGHGQPAHLGNDRPGTAGVSANHGPGSANQVYRPPGGATPQGQAHGQTPQSQSHGSASQSQGQSQSKDKQQH